MWTTAKQSTCAFSKPFTRGWLAAGWTVLATGRTGRTSASRVKDRDLGVTNWWMAGMRLCHLNTYKYKFWPSLLISHVFFFFFFFCPAGTDPATDLRGTGFLGLMHTLYFVMDPETLPLARDIYKLSQHPTQVSPDQKKKCSCILLFWSFFLFLFFPTQTLDI